MGRNRRGRKPLITLIAMALLFLMTSANVMGSSVSSHSPSNKEQIQAHNPSFVDDDAPGQGIDALPRKKPGNQDYRTDSPAVDLTKPDVVWLNDLLSSKESSNEQQGETLNSICGCTRVLVTLKKVIVFENNESGNDEWRFKVKIGNESWNFPGTSSYYTIDKNASFPYKIDFNRGLVNKTLNLTDGQTLGILFGVEAREIDTFSDDVSTASGAQGLVIPTEKVWYSIIATGDTPVQFEFEISAISGDSPSPY